MHTLALIESISSEAGDILFMNKFPKEFNKILEDSLFKINLIKTSKNSCFYSIEEFLKATLKFEIFVFS